MDDGLDQVVKSIIIHYYFAYRHPYFDGNGRMARLLQLWYLVQIGYTSSLFIPFSAFINESKGSYYKAFTLISNNSKVSEILDVTPFVSYFIDNVLTKLQKKAEPTNALKNLITCSKQVRLRLRKRIYFIMCSLHTEPMNFRPSNWKRTLKTQPMRQLETLSSNSKAKAFYLHRNMVAGCVIE